VVSVPEPEVLAATHDAVLDWYAANKRDLAFRRTTEPWAVLVSEVMAQQTQAARAAAAWISFMAAYPAPASLAGASPADVIRAWRGLGYNRRALALRRAARAIVDEHAGRVPDDLDALLRLPGIGPYTARAVLAIAFGRPVAALDVNIRRVLGRAFGLDGMDARELQVTADALVPARGAAAWTHALMDVGAAFCRPADPACGPCPLRVSCLFANGVRRFEVRSRAGAPIPFESTTRWLRGRILDQLRDAPHDAWVRFDSALGEHATAAVQAALASLAADGMIDLDGKLARLPLS